MFLKKTILCCLPVAVLTMVSAGAFAQNQLGDGRALDNNLQAGAGGRNSPLLVNTAGRYANALVTGNVSGLGAFHGNVGYGAENAFRGSLGSDSQYNFNRISGPGNPIYSVPGSTGMLNAITNPLYGASDIVQRNSTGYSTGEITGQYTPYGPTNSLTNPNARYNPAYGQSRTITFDQAQAYSSQPLAIGTDANGRQMAINASPLTGLTIQHNDIAPRDLNPSTAIENQPLDDNPATRRLPGQAAPLPDDADNAGNADSTTLRRTDTPANIAPLRLATGERLGQQMIQPAISASVNATDSATATDSVTGFSQSLDQLLGSSTAKPGDDVYLDLLNRIRDSAEKQHAPNTEVAPDNRLVPAPTPAPAPGDQTQPTTPNSTTPPKPEQSESLPEANAAPDSSQPDQTADRPIDRLVDKLDYNLPAITSFTGSAQTLYNEAMAEAERYMRAERYFDAQGVYNRATLLQPDKPLAYVGIINAELGAGLFVPAAKSLRNLFNAHPEMIAARYAQPLLPPDKRMADVRSNLAAYLKADTHSADGPLNLAYLAYQQQDTPALQSAFDIWATRAPHDPLLPLLRRIWIPALDAPSANQP